MSVEFEKAVMQKLDLMCNDISELKTDVFGLKKDVSELKTDVSGLKKDVSELKTDVSGLKKDVSELKTDVSGLKKDVSQLKTEVTDIKKDVLKLNKEVSVIKTNIVTLKKGLKEVKEDTEVLKNEVFNVIKPSLNSIEQKVDIMVNVNTARILQNQTINHSEIIKKFEKYEKVNELEHSRLDYEICKLKANA